MAGKLCTGAPTNNAGAGILQSSWAFCEGIEYRVGGTAAQRPIGDNPHEAGSENADAWDAGWTVANDNAGGQIPKGDAPCCAVGARTVPA